MRSPRHRSSKIPKVLTMKIDGLEFHGADEGDAGLGHQFGGTYYHSFVEGMCYELGEGISTSGYGSVDGLQQLDAEHVFAGLNRILRSVRIDAAPLDVNPVPSPSIGSFAVSLRQNSPAGTYRVSWNAYGSDADHVWLSLGQGLFVSSVTLLEIARLAHQKRIQLTPNLEAFLSEVERRFSVLPITGRICVQAFKFPANFPKDPADRVIGATAVIEGLNLVTADEAIRQSKAVPTIW